MSTFFRYPQTPHLAWLGATLPRDDKLLGAEQVEALLCDAVLVEEKLDGANLGFSLGPDGSLRIQNRGQYLHEPLGGQFTRLPDWLGLHGANLHKVLTTHAPSELILFGEWCAARHSLRYDTLPDWFLLFDVYDRRRKMFWSSPRRAALAKDIGLVTVPTLLQGRHTVDTLKAVLTQHGSRFRHGELEGVVVRRESTDWCEARAKLVRADFTQGLEAHWRSRPVEWNKRRWTSEFCGSQAATT
jgi:RNA ligase